MTDIKSHIGFKISLVIIIVTLLTPSFVKLAHAFEVHKHEVCETPQKSHYHELNLECEFYKFKLANGFNFEPQDFVIYTPFQIIETANFYTSLSGTLVRDSHTLRGPPQLI